MADGGPSDDAGFVPFADSPLWAIQRRYFEVQGVDAWRLGLVPHYVTSNPYVAHAYAQVILGFVRDCAAAPVGAPLFDAAHPLTIVELGAGHGRFSYHLLCRLTELLADSRFAGLRIRYVLTDLARSNVDAWKRHPRLAPFVEAGLVDFACFDAEEDGALELEVAEARIGPRALRSPIVVIANYLFDVLRQDLFRVEDGVISRGRVRLTREDGTTLERYEDESALALQLSYRFTPCEGPPYDVASWSAVLEEYAARGERRCVLFPSSPLRCLHRLSRLSRSGMLLLSADRGSHRLEDLPSAEPGFAMHGGCFSLPLNFHALGRVLTESGARVLSNRGSSLELSAAVFPPVSSDCVETALAFRTFLDHLSPDDFFLQKSVLERVDELAPEVVLATLRHGFWDAELLAPHLAWLGRALGPRPLEERLRWGEVLREVWVTHFPIGEGHDLGFRFGVLAAELGLFGDALRYYEESARWCGLDASTLHNAGLCLYELGRVDEAEEATRRALERNPDLDAAAQLAAAIARWRAALRDASFFGALPEAVRARAEPLGWKHAPAIARLARERPDVAGRFGVSEATALEAIASLDRAIALLDPTLGFAGVAMGEPLEVLFEISGLV